MITLSPEQEGIVSALDDRNVIVDAVAGSGKTTTILGALRRYRVPALVLTYNKQLKIETQERVARARLTHAEVHTYHSFGCLYIDPETCSTDIGLRAYVRGADKTIENLPRYELIVLDEVQDMTHTYYRLVIGIISGLRPDVRLLLLGDKNQSIYDFAGADSRYLTMADKLYPGLTRTWAFLSLSISYRLTDECAQFVNAVVGENRIRTIRSGPKPKLLVAATGVMVIDIIEALLGGGSKCSDIMVIAPSVGKATATGSLIREIERHLVHRVGGQVLVYIPSDDEAQLTQEVLAKKLLFSSFHQSKGIERNHVVVLGFDKSADFTSPESGRCGNPMYVALTRAKETLVLCNGEGVSLEYAPYDLIRDFVDCDSLVVPADSKGKDDWKRRVVTATTICKHLPGEFMERISKQLKTTHVRAKSPETIYLKCSAEQVILTGSDALRYYESVSAITGIAVGMAIEHGATGAVTVCVGGRAYGKRKLPNDKHTTFLRYAAKSKSLGDRLNFIFAQIKSFNWVTPEVWEEMVGRAKAVLPCSSFEFEVPLSCALEFGEEEKILNGRADVVADEDLYEIKAVSAVTTEHLVQLAVYKLCALKSTKKTPYRNYYLYNVLDDSLVRLDNTLVELKDIFQQILCAKFHKQAPLSDEDFLMAAGLDVQETCASCRTCGGR